MAKKSNAIAMTKAEDDWRAESDLRTLMEAEQIKNDAKRLAKAQALAKKKMMEVAKVASDD
jgi:pyocin large subunit-like protein